MRINSLLPIFLLVFFVSMPVMAQETMEETDFSAGSNITFDTDAQYKSKLKEGEEITGNKPEVAPDAEVTILEDKYTKQYIQPTVENISKLYWKKDVLDTSNDLAIDNFLLINECDLYQKFYDDDFEWLRIRDAAREMLKENKDSFSHQFKMLIPVDLGRYDMKRRGFPLINNTAFQDLRRVEIGGNSNLAKICEKSGLIEHYPKNLILILNKPFSYDFVNLDEHIAQAYIIRQKYNKIDRPRELQGQNFDRLAFARIRITFSKYQGETKGRDNFPLGIMFGNLDGIDIFEDADEKRLLTSVDF